MDGGERDGEMMSVERAGDRLKIAKVSLSLRSCCLKVAV